jgi:hypothetical protein
MGPGRIRRNKAQRGVKLPTKEAIEMGNIFTEDKNKMELLQYLDSVKLLRISKIFQHYPDGEVLCNEFIDLMTESFNEYRIEMRDDFVQQLVDLFFRCKKTTSKRLKFEQLTAYLIEHEIS